MKGKDFFLSIKIIDNKKIKRYIQNLTYGVLNVSTYII